MKKTIFYTGPWNNGIRPRKFMRRLSEYYYKQKMCAGCGKAFNTSFQKPEQEPYHGIGLA